MPLRPPEDAMLEPIWRGIYRTFREAPQVGPGFKSDTWRQNSLAKLRLQAEPAFSSTLLHALVAVRSVDGRVLRVLDFGGGLGLTYAALLKSTGNPSQIEYHIVEIPEVCMAGRTEFANDPRIRFHEALPELQDVGIVHAQSSLQYVEDWRGVLSDLVHYRAPYMILTDVPAGSFDPFVSLQTYYGSRIPCWFLNMDQLLSQLRTSGYRLLLKSRFFGSYLGTYCDYPMDNFPVELRVGASWNFLFAREA